MDDEVTVGWDAIDEAMAQIYGEQEPKHYGTLISYALGGQDPLDGISVFTSNSPVPHWHFVTYGFSELYKKESGYAEVSGYGFELTFRLVREKNEEEPPAWALNLLQNMGRYVFNSGNVFRVGDYLDANGPICLGADTQLTALSFVADPGLVTIDTPNGQVQFLQMVGITDDELEAMQTWNTLGVLEAGLHHIPFYITDLNRESLLGDEVISEAVNLGMEQDGSNTGILFVDQLEWEIGKKGLLRKSPSILTISAKQAEIIGKLLCGRLLKARQLTLSGPDIRIVLEQGKQSEYSIEDNQVRIMLDNQTVAEVSKNLIPKQSEFKIPTQDGLILRIAKTIITDQEGSVIKTIG